MGSMVEFHVRKDAFTLDVENGGDHCHQISDDIIGLLGKTINKVVDVEEDIEVNKNSGTPDIHLAHH